MKKNILALMLMASVSFSAVAKDDDAEAIPTNGLIAATTAGCGLLSEDITLNLSSGVLGAYGCNVSDNIISIAACHVNGRKGNVAIDCDPVAREAVGTTSAYTPPSGCAKKSNAVSDNDGTMTITGGVTYTANTRGGKIQGVEAENCIASGDTTAEAKEAAAL